MASRSFYRSNRHWSPQSRDRYNQTGLQPEAVIGEATVRQVFGQRNQELILSDTTYDDFKGRFNSKLHQTGTMERDTLIDGERNATGHQKFAAGDKIGIHRISWWRNGKWKLLRGTLQQQVNRTPFVGVLSIPRDQPAPGSDNALLRLHTAENGEDIYGYRGHFYKAEDFDVAKTGDIVYGTYVNNLDQEKRRKHKFVTASLERVWNTDEIFYTFPERASQQLLQERIDRWQCLLEHEAVLKKDQAQAQCARGEIQWVSVEPPVLSATLQLSPGPLPKDKKALKMKAGDEVHLTFEDDPGKCGCRAIVDEGLDDHQNVVLSLLIRGGASIELIHRELTHANQKVLVSGVFDHQHMDRIKRFIRNWEPGFLQKGAERRKMIARILLSQEQSKFPMLDVDPDESPVVLGSPAFPNFTATDQQQKIITNVLVNEHPVVLLEGPPGTGKSTLAALAVNAILNLQPDARILVCSPSHKAADNIGDLIYRIQQAGGSPIRAVRMYAPNYEETHATTNIPYALHSLALEENPTYPAQIHQLQMELKGHLDDLSAVRMDMPSQAERQAVLKMAQTTLKESEDVEDQLQLAVLAHVNPNVMITTCYGTGDERLQKAKFGFSHIIIDEAGQATTPEALFAIDRLDLQKAAQVFLVGDRHQLPPVVLSTGVAGGILESCLPATLEKAQAVDRIRLTESFRMHPAILHWPNYATYDMELVTRVTEADRALLLDKFPFPWRNHPQVFCVVRGEEDQPPGHVSRRNEDEVTLIVKIVRFLLNRGISTNQYAILTFYEAQRRLILQRLQENGLPTRTLTGGLVVANVDAFQGQEREIIILSCVRSHRGKKLPKSVGFLGKPNRPNVALTRARSGLIVVGNPEALSVNAYWHACLYGFAMNITVIHDPDTWLDRYMEEPATDWYDDHGFLKYGEPHANDALIDHLEGDDRDDEHWEVVDEIVGEDGVQEEEVPSVEAAGDQASGETSGVLVMKMDTD